MTNDKDSAVLAERVERVTKWLDGGCSTWGTPMQDIREILNALRQPTQSDALREENKRLREALRTVEQGVPRLVGKSWFPDGRPSKHDQCVHGIWMYEPCEGCTDAFIAEALGETK